VPERTDARLGLSEGLYSGFCSGLSATEDRYRDACVIHNWGKFADNPARSHTPSWQDSPGRGCLWQRQCRRDCGRVPQKKLTPLDHALRAYRRVEGEAPRHRICRCSS
jgi:hypothetical protein